MSDPPYDLEHVVHSMEYLISLSIKHLGSYHVSQKVSSINLPNGFVGGVPSEGILHKEINNTNMKTLLGMC